MVLRSFHGGLMVVQWWFNMDDLCAVIHITWKSQTYVAIANPQRWKIRIKVPRFATILRKRILCVLGGCKWEPNYGMRY